LKKKDEDYQRTDQRQNIQRYFKLFAAKFKWENGDKKQAKQDLEWIIKTTLLDTANEKLFLARLYEGLSKAYNDDGEKGNYAFYRNQFIEEYPQLAPFSGIKMQMKLNISGVNDDVIKSVISDLKNCNIEFINNADNNIPSAFIQFNKRGDKYEATINVRGGSGKIIVVNSKLIFKNSSSVGKELALRLFNKGGAIMFETPANNQ